MAGLVFGLGHFIVGLYWLPQAFVVSFDGNLASGLGVGVPLMLALSFYSALYTALVCGLTRAFPAVATVRPFVFAGLWVLAEMARAVLFTGWAWNLIGYIFAGSLPFMQLAAFGGIWLMSFVAVFAAAVLFSLRTKVVPAVLVLALGFAVGSWRLHTAPALGSTPTNTRIAVVQTNTKQEDKWAPNLRQHNLAKYVEMSFSPQTQDVDIFIWPETAITFLIDLYPQIIQEITKNLPDGATLMSGFPRTEEGKYFNSVGSFTPQGHRTSFYDKHNLIPVGEYIPFRQYLPDFINKLTEGAITDYSHGTGPVNLSTESGINALPMICYEVTFPHFVANNIEGKDFLLEITNDAWFEGTTAPYQHYAMAKIRAVETGLPLVRAAGTGISAVVDPYGRELGKIGMDKEKIMTFYLPEKIERPLFLKFSAPIALDNFINSSYDSR